MSGDWIDAPSSADRAVGVPSAPVELQTDPDFRGERVRWLLAGVAARIKRRTTLPSPVWNPVDRRWERDDVARSWARWDAQWTRLVRRYARWRWQMRPGEAVIATREREAAVRLGRVCREWWGLDWPVMRRVIARYLAALGA